MIPLFKNTEQALAYGQSIKGDYKALYALKEARKEALQRFNELMTLGKENEALYLASGQAQFLREALTNATK